MRLKILFDSNIFGGTQKLWIDAPELETAESFIEYLKCEFDIEQNIELYLDEFFIHPQLDFSCMAKDSDTLNVKCSEQGLGRRLRYDKEKTEKLSFVPTEFQGKKIKFNEEGNITEIVPVEQNLRILSPAEEFLVKKSEWKIKPVPKRKALKQELCPKLICTQEVIQYDQLEIGMKIRFTEKCDPVVKV